jgi:hypothetical protein
MLIFVTISAIVVAIAACGVAWRTVREDRQRSDARVAALAQDIHGSDAFDLDLRGTPRASSVRYASAPAPSKGSPRNADPAPGDPDRAARYAEPMFVATVAPARGGSRFSLALAVVCFIAVTVLAAAMVLSGSPAVPAASARESTTARSAALAGSADRDTSASASVPLELVSLAHERDGDTLTVRGTVRNPSSGSEMSRLTAVVFLFDRDGGFLTSGRAAVDSPQLIPGGESAFSVSVPAVGAVARYRVSFRSGDRIVSHVDKRNRS